MEMSLLCTRAHIVMTIPILTNTSKVVVLVELRNITQATSHVHGPKNRFENKDFGCHISQLCRLNWKSRQLDTTYQLRVQRLCKEKPDFYCCYSWIPCDSILPVMSTLISNDTKCAFWLKTINTLGWVVVFLLWKRDLFSSDRPGEV